MVGILAMADTVEEYDQPCKKQRKDVEDSPTNTIRSYFSPVSKSVDASSPSPKSSNILDYFKKTQSGQRVASPTTVEWEEKHSAGISVNSKELTTDLEGKHQPPKRKLSGKRVNLSDRLVASEHNVVVDISDASSSSVIEACDVRSGFGVLGSDTAALIAQLCAESQELFEDDKEDASFDLNTSAQRKTAAGARKGQCKESVNLSKKSQKLKFGNKEVHSPGLSDVENVVNNCCESSSEGTVASQFEDQGNQEDQGTCLGETNVNPTDEETSSLNNSTVTVSFEDFMKNQENEEVLAEKVAGLHSEVVQESCQSDSLVENADLTIPQSASPKIVTVHVQIHPNPVSTLPRVSKLKRHKIASIFLRKKADTEDEAVEHQAASPHSADGADPAPPRRSNVVIAEEELELCVLDITDKAPVKTKCGRVEREQFMNAFRQPPSMELAKSGVKKTAQKPRDPKEGLAPSEAAAEEGREKLSQEKENEQSVKPVMSNQTSKDSRMKLKKRGNTIMKKLKGRKSSQDFGKTECENVIDGEERETGPIVDTSESRHLTHIDPATTRASETCRVTRQSLRQQRDVSIHCQTLNKPIAGDCLGTPVHVSTPKRIHWSSEANDIYKAEMLPVTSNQSPIRMKFTRLSQSKYAGKARKMNESLDFTPKSNQICRAKNLAKAKRLVEKAKAQSKCRNHVETITPLRRSSRRQARFDEKFYGNENLAINLSSSTESILSSSVRNDKKPKTLKNVSDVLGKNLDKMSAAKNPAVDVKVASIFLAKKVIKGVPLELITILDESSCNGSENSQDVEQFRAKRQFLMSGLPDTLKKHIAKTAAALEIYSAANLSFQIVVHVQQKSQASLLWDLPWPDCAILNRLQGTSERMEGILTPSLSLGDFSEVKHTTTTSASWIGLSNWRTEFSQDVQRWLLEEIKSSNPEFPVRKLFKPLLQKRSEYFADLLRTGSSTKVENSVIDVDAEPQQALTARISPGPLLGKRKRKLERRDQKQKRMKALDRDQEPIVIQDEGSCTRAEASAAVEGSTRNERDIQNQNCTTRKRLSRSAKRKLQECEHTTGAAEVATMPVPLCGSELTDLPKREEAAISDGVGTVKEDLLWTEKYQPQHSSELVGNLRAVRKLRSWLMEWKKRADQEETKSQKERKAEKDKKVDAWDNSDFNMESSGDEDFLCNTVLITGPPGVGKTAAVYACAQELGFKVFEVNASSQRSGRQILSQLKEATQSHQVDKQGAGALKPAFFSGSRSLPNQTARSPKKPNSPRSVVRSPRKAVISPRKKGSKKSLAPVFLANFFKAPLKSNKSEELDKPDDNRMSVKPQKICKTLKTSGQVSEVSKIPAVSEPKDTEECHRKSATSLILFEEVDVIFDEDAGFLNAIKTFMATAKRPVILTTTDPNFSLMFECCFEEIRFKMPSPANVASYLQLLCLAENLRTDMKDITTLLALNKCDIRQSILYLQFWVRSGGGYKVDKLLPAEIMCVLPASAEKEPVKTAEDAVERWSKGSSAVKKQEVPKCNTGCAENLLGFKGDAEPSNGLFSMFKSDPLTLEQWRRQVQVLLEFQRRRLDFIFSSLEFLLPLPQRVVPHPKKPGNGTGPSAGDPPANSSPVETSGRTKHCRKSALFDDSDLFDRELNDSSAFVTLPNETSTSSSAVDKVLSEGRASAADENVPPESRLGPSVGTVKKPRTLTQKRCSQLVSSCLGSLAAFADTLSFLDSYLSGGAGESEGLCGRSSNHWAAAEIKTGMLDERRLDPGDWWSFHRLGEVRADVEALSWSECRSQITRTLDSSGTKCTEPGVEAMQELTLHVPNHPDSNTTFTDHLHYHNSTASKRIDVLQTVFSNNKASVGLGHRRASATEYLPALRTICRAEKLKEKGKAKRRFLHYLDGVHMELPKTTLESLAADFP